MSGRRRPPRLPGGPRAGVNPRQQSYGDDAILSEEEVQRRINVEGGGQLQAPPPEHKFRDRSPTPPPVRRREARAARDSFLLIGLVIAGLVAIGVLLPDGPLTSSATDAPSPPGSAAAVGPSAPRGTGPAPTGGLITLPPDPSAPVTELPPTAVPTPTKTPAPGSTPRPVATPRVTPKPTPTRTPTPTVKPPTPTPPPTTATLNVVVTVNNAGGFASASDWTVRVTTGSTVFSDPGSASGASYTIAANVSYSVTANTGPSGYSSSSTSSCSSSGGPAPGSTVNCTITKTGIDPVVTVTTNVNDGGPFPNASDWSVSAPGGSPSSFAGSSGGVAVTYAPGANFTITSEDASGTDYTFGDSGTCSSTGLAPGATANCTFTYTYVPPPPTPAAVPLLPLALPAAGAVLGGRRRWATYRTS